MKARVRLFAELKTDAERKDLPFLIEMPSARGGHALVFVGTEVATVPSREIDPRTEQRIRQALGLD
jgi:hypothetical protein